MPIDLTLTKTDGKPVDPQQAKVAFEDLFTGIAFEESDDPQIRFEQLKALNTPEVVLNQYKNMKRRFEGVIETEEGSIYVEFPSREPVDSALVEVRGDSLHINIIQQLLDSVEWTLNDGSGNPITGL